MAFLYAYVHYLDVSGLDREKKNYFLTQVIEVNPVKWLWLLWSVNKLMVIKVIVTYINIFPILPLVHRQSQYLKVRLFPSSNVFPWMLLIFRSENLS